MAPRFGNRSSRPVTLSAEPPTPEPYHPINSFLEKFSPRVRKLVMSQRTTSSHLIAPNDENESVDVATLSQDISARDINPAKLTSLLRDKFGSGSYNVHSSSGLDDAQYVHDTSSATSFCSKPLSNRDVEAESKACRPKSRSVLDLFFIHTYE
ncbi:hypothetical protein CABS01_13020 [Colletotrichum abscissum]|uniref:Uncharacterized protein n=1 Tax=Colletotrichum abscissum TaxID=1671311 RepID=A0A9P9XLF7_9PEZI|nr:uncharacterized protein CABS01_13020 [Colletotrichum abscissum]KAI3556118.1 hypothetical protein CABS02_03827 [Colletotrichum abscissum]KAK1486887.1 hypothetical protein CABS01_13020 [Colletotrichum abscissum]